MSNVGILTLYSICNTLIFVAQAKPYPRMWQAPVGGRNFNGCFYEGTVVELGFIEYDYGKRCGSGVECYNGEMKAFYRDDCDEYGNLRTEPPPKTELLTSSKLKTIEYSKITSVPPMIDSIDSKLQI